MTAGRRDQLISLERATVEQDPYGEEVSTWAEICTEFAAVYYGRGDERRQAAMEQGSQVCTFQMLSNPLTRSLTTTDRIQYKKPWDIERISYDTPKRGYIEIEATSAV